MGWSNTFVNIKENMVKAEALFNDEKLPVMMKTKLIFTCSKATMKTSEQCVISI